MADQNSSWVNKVISDPLGAYTQYAGRAISGGLSTVGNAVPQVAAVAGAVWIVNIAVFVLLVWLVLKYAPKILRAAPKVIPI